MNRMLGREGEDGWLHVISTGVDHSSSFVSAEIHYKSPSGVVTDKTTDTDDAAAGTYGWTVAADFFTVGRWEAQLTLELGASGSRKLTTPILFWIGEDGE